MPIEYWVTGLGLFLFGAVFGAATAIKTVERYLREGNYIIVHRGDKAP